MAVLAKSGANAPVSRPLGQAGRRRESYLLMLDSKMVSWKQRIRLPLDQPLAVGPDLLHAALQASLRTAHALDGAFNLLHAAIQLAHGALGIEETAGELLDGRLNLFFEDLQ